MLLAILTISTNTGLIQRHLTESAHVSRLCFEIHQGDRNAVKTVGNITRRYITALVLTVIYLTITMSPLAPLALRSARLAHAITGDCSGDCNVCGCTAEQRATKTCCCQQKKKLQAKHTSSPGGCCQKKSVDKQPALQSSCPCGSDKQLALLNITKSELIPFDFAFGIFNQETTTKHHDHPQKLWSRFSDPPDPPPRLFVICS